MGVKICIFIIVIFVLAIIATTILLIVLPTNNSKHGNYDITDYMDQINAIDVIEIDKFSYDAETIDMLIEIVDSKVDSLVFESKIETLYDDIDKMDEKHINILNTAIETVLEQTVSLIKHDEDISNLSTEHDKDIADINNKLNQHDETINLKVDANDFIVAIETISTKHDDLNGRLDRHDIAIDLLLQSIGDSWLDMVTQTIRSIEIKHDADVAEINDKLDDKVDVETFNETMNNKIDREQYIADLDSRVQVSVLTSIVQGINDNISSNIIEIDDKFTAITNSINDKYDEDMLEINRKLNEIDTLNAAIDERVNKTDFDSTIIEINNNLTVKTDVFNNNINDIRSILDRLNSALESKVDIDTFNTAIDAKVDIETFEQNIDVINDILSHHNDDISEKVSWTSFNSALESKVDIDTFNSALSSKLDESHFNEGIIDAKIEVIETSRQMIEEAHNLTMGMIIDELYGITDNDVHHPGIHDKINLLEHTLYDTGLSNLISDDGITLFPNTYMLKIEPDENGTLTMKDDTGFSFDFPFINMKRTWVRFGNIDINTNTLNVFKSKLESSYNAVYGRDDNGVHTSGLIEKVDEINLRNTNLSKMFGFSFNEVAGNYVMHLFPQSVSLHVHTNDNDNIYLFPLDTGATKTINFSRLKLELSDDTVQQMNYGSYIRFNGEDESDDLDVDYDCHQDQ